MIRKFFHWLIEEQKKSNKRREATLEKWNNWAIQHSNKQCPKCDSKNIKMAKPNLYKKWTDASLQMWTMGLRKPSKTLNVCRDCGFSWEDR